MKVFSFAFVLLVVLFSASSIILSVVEARPIPWYSGKQFVDACYTPLKPDPSGYGCETSDGSYWVSLRWPRPQSHPDPNKDKGKIRINEVHTAYGPTVALGGKALDGNLAREEMLDSRFAPDSMMYQSKYFALKTFAAGATNTPEILCSWKEGVGMYVHYWVWVPSDSKNQAFTVIEHDDWVYILVNGVPKWQDIGCCKRHELNIQGYLTKGAWNHVLIMAGNYCAPGYLLTSLAWRQ